jgi:hypothetical protein
MRRCSGLSGEGSESGVCAVRGDEFVCDVPRQEFGDTFDWVLVDVGEYVAQVGFGVEAIEFGGADQAVDRGSAFAASVRARKEEVFSSQGHASQCALGSVVIDLNASVVDKSGSVQVQVQVQISDGYKLH